MADSKSRIDRIYSEILNGLDKTQSRLKPLTPREVAQWDLIVQEIKDIKAMGGEVDIPHEVP
jgi:hypothetical protein